MEQRSANDGIVERVGTPPGLLDRKQALRSVASALAAGMALSAQPAGAFDRSFPTELADDDSASTTGTLIGKRSTVAQRREAAVATKQKLDQNLASFSPRTDALPSLTWGLAIFFASGSRSNPLATPLANLIYSEETEPWLRDRNAGLFGPLPLPFLGLLGVVFLVLGTVVQYTLLQLSGGDSGVCGQLAGVALINGGFFEIGRIARYVAEPGAVCASLESECYDWCIEERTFRACLTVFFDSVSNYLFLVLVMSRCHITFELNPLRDAWNLIPNANLQLCNKWAPPPPQTTIHKPHTAERKR